MKLIVAIGPPGSGKSTWWDAHNHLFEQPTTRVNMDKIRGDLTGSESDMSQNNKVAQIAHSNLKGALAQGIPTIYWDNTTARKSYRKDLILWAKQANYEVIAIHFKIPLSVCLERNKNRNRQVPQQVIERMWNEVNSSPPEYSEGFDDIWIELGD
jgi:predicted kinase